ncbi:GntR family transcriptional regulator [Inquilinus sp. CA228]|uniref:GntR family transcriptional regulator n=1 Tax=Inquilinus sp. CA228 TaxID=3455609 RepID=UPI003F8D12DC
MLTGLQEARSLTEAAYVRLRADILACRLRPGQRLKINDLCAQLGVSLSAVREALSRLSAEGFVISEAQKRFQVAPVSAADLDDLTRTRVEIETLCLRRAMAVRGIDWETGLVAAYHRLSRTPERVEGDERRVSEDWAAAHADYHLALVAACDSPWLLRLRAMLYVQSERYRRLSVPMAEHRRDLDGEHHRIMAAVLAGDAEAGCRLLSDHLLLTMSLVRDLTQQEGVPEPPAAGARTVG